ncbi:MAG: PIN domain-containing protein [Panacagrimonas sp.]
MERARRLRPRKACGLEPTYATGAARILPIDESISAGAMKLIDTHALSHGLKLGDALIAATALEHELTLLTANTKHFIPIRGLKTEAFDP